MKLYGIDKTIKCVYVCVETSWAVRAIVWKSITPCPLDPYYLLSASSQKCGHSVRDVGKSISILAIDSDSQFEITAWKCRTTEDKKKWNMKNRSSC